MNKQDMELILKNISYKDVEFHMDIDDRNGDILLRMKRYGLCSITGETTPLHFVWGITKSGLEDLKSECDFVQLVRAQVHRWEIHEADEHFKYQGKLYSDPHEENPLREFVMGRYCGKRED